MNDTAHNTTDQDSSASLEPYHSPTVQVLRLSGVLKDSDASAPKTTCEHCRAAVWTLTEAELRCYCRVMHVIAWSRQEPNNLVSCDAQQS